MAPRSKGFGLLIYLAMVLGILGALGIIAYKIRQSGYDSAMLAVEEANAKHRKKRELIIVNTAEELEKTKEKTRVIYKTITKEVDRVVLTYLDKPCLDDRGVSVANSALTRQASPAAQPDKALPPTNPAR